MSFCLVCYISLLHVACVVCLMMAITSALVYSEMTVSHIPIELIIICTWAPPLTGWLEETVPMIHVQLCNLFPSYS